MIHLLTPGAIAAWMLLVTAASAAPPETSAVFDRVAASILQIRVVEQGSSAKAVIGSGFIAGPNGEMVTNYHVISKLVFDPSRYRAEVVRRDGSAAPLQLRAIDVVHDVALVSGPADLGPPLPLADAAIAQGTRLYALGYPHDLGLSIVEGTFNGYLDHTLYQKIHFTGSINPGMSGGPTITAAGEVVGINVSTAGNQVSFLVPAARARALLGEIAPPADQPPTDWLDVVRRQLLASQDAYFASLLEQPLATEAIAQFTLPGRIAPFVKCWGDAERDKEQRYELVNQSCSTDDYLFLSGDQLSGILQYQHRVLTSDELNPFQFFTLYGQYFANNGGFFFGSEDKLTRFRCETRAVENAGTIMKAVFCLRGYRKLPGVYDAVVKAAVLGPVGAGAETSLTLSGVSFENARRLAGRYLEAITWTR
ncbi:MAG: S1 family peptidase [Candidatus Binatia bacterium]